MSFKSFPYPDIDGMHWPDTYLNNAEYYAVDYSDWASKENDSVLSVTWSLPIGLIGSDSHEAGGKAFIKIKAEARGSFRVVCTLTAEESGKQQTKIVEMILKVY